MTERRSKKIEFTFDATGSAQYAACSVCGKSSTNFFWINGITYCWEHVPSYANGQIVPLSQHTAETFQANIEAAYANGYRAALADAERVCRDNARQTKWTIAEYAALRDATAIAALSAPASPPAAPGRDETAGRGMGSE
jgi:hypothetical protein